MSIGLARVTISAPQRRVDVALPEHAPLAELLPEVLRHAGEHLADDGEGHGGWLLRRTDGAALTTAQGLFPQGVRDGEVLHLVPATVQWPELEYDDVVEAVAEGARRRGAAWSPAATRTATLVAGALLLTVVLAAVLRAGPGWPGAPFTALGGALLLALAGSAASRAYGDGRTGAALGACALPYAFTGGAVLVGRSSATGGVLAPLPWLDGPALLAGSVAVLLVAALGAVGVATRMRVFTAGLTVGLLGAAAALTGLLLPADGTAAVLACVLVCGLGLLPVLAIRFGRMPTPPVALPAGGDAALGFTGAPGEGAAAGTLDTARERPDRQVVLAAVSRTEELLTGMLLGWAAAAVAAFTVLAVAGGTAGQWLLAVAATSLLLRARLFVTLRQRVPLVVAGLAGAALLGLDLTAGASPLGLTAVVLGALALALAAVVAGATYSRRPPSPYLGRAADVFDTLVVVAVIPVACAVMGLYERLGGVDL